MSGLFYCEPKTNWSYIDALFMATTGTTNTGLNTIPMSDMSTYQMIILYLSAFLGNHVLISFYVLMVRRYYFSKRFEDVLAANRKRKEEYKLKKQQESHEKSNQIHRRFSLISAHSANSFQFSLFKKDRRESSTYDIKKSETQLKEFRTAITDENSELSYQNKDSSRRTSGISPLEVSDEKNSNVSIDENRNIKNASISNAQQITFREDTNVLRERERRKFQLQTNKNELENCSDLIYQTNSEYEIMSRPAVKSELTRDERFRMGGIEYSALNMLVWIVVFYYLGFILLFGFLFRIYIGSSLFAQTVLKTSNTNGSVDPWFFSFFISLSAFTNLGLNHLDASMSLFQNAPCPLILCIILILVGNTAYAIALRFIIWLCHKLTPKTMELTRETFRYLLDHPRRCYTTLFPAKQTWWLLIILIIITLVELVSFLSLNYWLPVLSGISWGSRFLDGLFQSVATRNAGFSVISLADLNPGSQLVYIVAMYISVYPVAISMRNSNIYQERSLGIFRGENEDPQLFSENELSEAPFINLKRQSTVTSIANHSKKILKGPDFFVITQIQRQLTSDICWVITGIFLVCVIESKAIMSSSSITIATVIYECVSAFGNVGASTGYPNTSASQAAQYRNLGKLVIIALMYRGKHRGLPASIDRSILLPSDELAEKEKEDELRRRKTSTNYENDTYSQPRRFSESNTTPQPIYTRSCTL